MAKDLISKSKEWQALATHCEQVISKTHLKNLLQDADRCKGLFVEFDGVLLDFSRQRVTEETLNLLFGGWRALQSGHMGLARVTVHPLQTWQTRRK